MSFEFIQTLFISVISGLVGGYISYKIQESKLKKEFQLQDSAEKVAHQLLSDEEWKLRSFGVIRHHLGGFEEDELRKILVRSGAIRFKSKNGHELWGLVSRNTHRLGVTTIDVDPQNLNNDLFK